jgi:signal transduction histidine kinase
MTAAVLEAAPCGIALLRGADLVYELANPTFRELVGGADVVGTRFGSANRTVADRVLPRLVEVARTGKPFDADDVTIDVEHPTGGPTQQRHLGVRARALEGSGGRPAVLLVVVEVTAHVVARRRAYVLADLATEVAAATSQQEALARAAVIARETLGASDCIALLADPDGDRMRGTVQADGGRVEIAVDLADLETGSRAVQLRSTLYLPADVARGLEAGWVKRAGSPGALCIPLAAGGRPRGLLYVLSWVPAAPPQGDLTFAHVLGATCGLALERVAAYEIERAGRLASEQATHRLELLSESGAALSKATNWSAVVQATAQFPLGYLADVVVLDLVGEGGVLRREAVESLERGILAEGPGSIGTIVTSAPIRGALDTLRPRRISRRAGGGAAALDPDQALLHQLCASSCIVAPLVLRHEAAGVLTVARRAKARPHDHEDVLVAAEIARRAALALDDARQVVAAQQELRLRDEFLALASHELRSPLTVLQLATQVARKAHPLDAALARVDRATQRLSGLVDQLLDAVTAGAKDLPLELEELNLTAVVRQLVDELRDVLSVQGTEIRLHADAPVVGRWDRVRVESIVSNVISNAVKFGLGRPVDVGVEATDGVATIRVLDHGIGIDPELQTRIFGRYERGVASTAYGGLGLGLWIVRRFAESLGGCVHAASDRGAGTTTVTVELPMTPSHGSSA